MRFMASLFGALLLLAPLNAGALEPRPLSEPAADETALREQRVALKSLQAELLLDAARLEWNERHESRRRTGHGRRPASHSHRDEARTKSPGQRLRPAGDTPRRPVSIAQSPAVERASDVLGGNIRVNPPPASWTQSEVGLAAIGTRLVMAWNDGTLPFSTGPLAYSTSTDAGRSWSIAAPLPVGNGVISWESDPVLVADSGRGEFWFCALALVSKTAANGIGFVKGVFGDSGFVWERVGYVRAARDTLFDKPWIAVDPRSGALMASYTSFYRAGRQLTDRIEFQRSLDGGLSWSPKLGLSLPRETGLVQGSRPAVGPEGEVHVVWATVDTSEGGRGLDELRIRTSSDGGGSFHDPVTLARIVTNFASGAPGYNRPYAINFPSIAVDCSSGPGRGRIYVAWMESADFYSTALGSLRSVVERKGQGQPTNFEIGDVVRGSHVVGDSPHAFQFLAHRGGTALFMLDSLGGEVDLALGVGCEEDPFQLAYSDPPQFGRPRVALVSFSRDGVFTLNIFGRGTLSGGFRIRTGWQREGQGRGRDVRDVFVASSQDGSHWSNPSRVSDAPPGTDDWLPELAVGPAGEVYAAWYDWSDSPALRCGALSNTRLSRSMDGGRSWQRVGTLSNESSDWSAATSNIVPNQGDYIGLAVDTLGVSVGWADARGGTPDIYFAHVDPARLFTLPVPLTGVSLGAPHPNPTRGELRVAYAAMAGVPARIELWDIAGRRLQQQLVPVVAAAAELKLVLPPGLAAGVYLLRFTQGPLSATARVALIP